jgi:Rieske Fe-S protein
LALAIDAFHHQIQSEADREQDAGCDSCGELAGEIPIGGVKLFHYPGPKDQCIMVRTGADSYVAYSQKCTHLSCAVYYARAQNRLECPCHEGYFSITDGSVLQGPPTRPLPRVVLERRGVNLVAVGMEAKES